MRLSQQVAGAPDLEVVHGDLEPGAQLGELHQGLQALLGLVGEGRLVRDQQVGVGLGLAAAHPAPQLVELGQSHGMGPVDDDGVGRRDVQTGFDDGGAHQDIDFPAPEAHHHLLQFLFGHLAMGHGHPGLRHHFLDMAGPGGQAPHPVVHEKDLAAPVQFPADGRLDHRGLRPADVGAHGPAVLRRGVDQAQLPEAGQGQLQGPGDGRGGEGQDVHGAPPFLQPLLLPHPETLLFVDDDQPQVPEDHVFGQQPVGADEDVHFALGQVRQDAFLLRRRLEPAQDPHLQGEMGQAAA